MKNLHVRRAFVIATNRQAIFDKVVALGAKTAAKPAFNLGWASDNMAPDNFLVDIFHSNAEYNYGRCTNLNYDALIDKAKETFEDPLARQLMYNVCPRGLRATSGG